MMFLLDYTLIFLSIGMILTTRFHLILLLVFIIGGIIKYTILFSCKYVDYHEKSLLYSFKSDINLCGFNYNRHLMRTSGRLVVDLTVFSICMTILGNQELIDKFKVDTLLKQISEFLKQISEFL